MNCTHKFDQVVWMGKDNKVYMQCQNCEDIISPTVNFELVKKLPPDYRPELNAISKAIRN